MGLVVGLDASRNRSGGAKAHLIGIISNGDPTKHGISQIHLWSYKKLLDDLPDASWLIKHNPYKLELSLMNQVWWQYRCLAKEAREAKCDLLFTTDASTLCRFQPMVVLSQDMLSYEPGVMRHYGFTKARVRLIAILFIQNQAMRFAAGVIFLTQYAAQLIQKVTGKLARIAIIPHGVDPAFIRNTLVRPRPWENERPIRCLYVSNTAMYKYQWVVVRAIAKLRKRGHNINIILAGGGTGRAQKLLEDEISISDPQGLFVKTIDFVPHNELPALLDNADLFIFASSCENLPVTLLEAMAVGLPIACSNRGPMPEVLEDGGVYFDPENAESISTVIEKIIVNEDLRISIAKRARKHSEQYSWARCAAETWDFLRNIAETRKI